MELLSLVITPYTAVSTTVTRRSRIEGHKLMASEPGADLGGGVTRVTSHPPGAAAYTQLYFTT